MIQCFFRCTVALWTLEDLLWEKDAQRARAAKKIQAFIRNRKYRAKLLLWRKLARLEEAARIQRDLAEADTFLAQGRASDQEAREAESLLVIEPAAEEAKDNEGKYHIMCAQSLDTMRYLHLLLLSLFVQKKKMYMS